MKIVHLIMVFVTIGVLVLSARSVETIAQQKTALEVSYLPSSEFMQMASLGYRNLASDLLWFKAVQYYGGYRLAQNGIRLFGHLADVITDLDPKFKGAYKLSALIISEDLGEHKEGVRLMEKGLRNNPDDYWLTYEMGFLHYLGGHDYTEAEKYFSLAATLPGADEKAARFAADAAKKGGDYESSIELWAELADNSDDKYIRELAIKYIAEIKAEMEAGKTGRESGGTEAGLLEGKNNK
jgi:tetratricopeptide (TPR) repeat protein